MSDHDEIYLQPECCADPYTGRLWCQDPDPEDCEEGVPWTRYVRADRIAELEAGRQWISAAERLPDPERNFLSFGHYGYGVSMYSTNPLNSTGLPTFEALKVSHWMPLPQPPTKEK